MTEQELREVVKPGSLVRLSTTDRPAVIVLTVGPVKKRNNEEEMLKLYASFLFVDNARILTRSFLHCGDELIDP